MTELSGTLDGLGLSAIVRFLNGLHKNGCLRLTEGDWSGEIYFANGNLSHAIVGSRTGLTALDALIELFPNANFAFDSNAQLRDAPTIRLDHDAVLAHLEDVSARVARGERALPRLDAVPAQAGPESEAEEPVQVDRASLQTLMLVDGRRSVREIVGQRGSMDAAWQLLRLREAGLIQLDSPALSAKAPEVHQPPRTLPEVVAPAPPVAEVAAPPKPMEVAAEPEPVPPPVTAAPVAPPPPGSTRHEDPALVATTHCPRLGFEDDPSSSFGRPTRLHRCFAAGRPLPLSLDQQRELCLTDQFPTCPRMMSAGSNSPSRPARAAEAGSEQRAANPRIVRLPFAGRTSSVESDQPEPVAPVADGSAPSRPDPRPLRPARLRGPDISTADDTSASPVKPTPLRARFQRGGNVAVAAPPAAPTTPIADTVGVRRRVEPPVQPAPPTPPDSGDGARIPFWDRRVGPVPVMAVAGVGVVIVVLAIAAILLPQLGSVLGDNEVDPNSLPNTRLVESGTPVANLALTRPTLVAANASPQSASNAAPAADASPITAPTDAASAPASGPSAARPQASAAPVEQPTSVTNAALFDERFTTNDAGWPSSPTGAALITDGSYRIVTRQAGQFAAVSAPAANIPSDVAVSATFRKLAGPPGGGYGIILRDQSDAPRDGTSQDGRYYVLEAGDKGEVGIWRRDSDHWVDLLPWQHSDSVKTDTATNELVVKAIGNTLSLTVNGVAVAARTDTSLTAGRVGVFVGGDGNQVAVSRFTIQTP